MFTGYGLSSTGCGSRTFHRGVERPGLASPCAVCGFGRNNLCGGPFLLCSGLYTLSRMQFPFLSSDRIKPKPAHLILGAEGETIAEAYLRSIGYEIRNKNVRIGRGEIDIIAWDPEDQVLVFTEVKTRSEKTLPGFHPDKAATEDKRVTLRRAARRWVADHDFDGGYRIDLVCVQEGRVTNHFKELSWDLPPRSVPWP